MVHHQHKDYRGLQVLPGSRPPTTLRREKAEGHSQPRLGFYNCRRYGFSTRPGATSTQTTAVNSALLHLAARQTPSPHQSSQAISMRVCTRPPDRSIPAFSCRLS